MGFLRLAGGAAATFAAMSMAVPAEAQRYHGSRHHHRGDNDGVGGFILGALFVGGIAALASGEKKRREREAVYQEDYEAPPVEGEEGSAPPRSASSPVADIPAPGSAEYDGLYDPDAAADRCAVAAEVDAQKFARLSRVTSISSTVWNGKSWVVKGNVELAESYRDEAKRSFNFRCALKAGSEPEVSIPGLAPAA
ncbi:hypothetical protein IAG41_14555 [Sphingomonas sp. JC676]|uniref:hypothetical protein n=1 Tax=Sphingomonas sp. JC676 TaxID=2768065 RepID=UPI001657DD67|nr:hypothetical protein [Sphingomonas sp. JC676]MBC9033615.1 hypothetical protein [Sphingomonas sp. JC676]